MTLNLLRRGRVTEAEGLAEPLPMGLEDAPPEATCPRCGRPISMASTRCPGCGTRLLVGVPARRAGLFVAIGGVIGLLVGGTLVGLASGATRPSALGGAGGSGAASAGQGDGLPGSAGAVPASAAPALRRVLVVDERLTSSIAPLQQSLASKRFSASAVATVLRSVAVDAAQGVDGLPMLDGWAGAATLRAHLVALYADLRGATLDTLDASVTNASAYRSGGAKVLALLGTVASADDQVRALAVANGLDLGTPAP